MKLVRYTERPDLRERRFAELSSTTFPTFMHHNEVGPRFRRRLYDWQEWTGMRFPDDGTYVFPGGLAPLEVASGVGVHVEPNVWMRHAV